MTKQKIEQGQFYQRKSGNIFRVICAVWIWKDEKHKKVWKLRNIRIKGNGKPYTYQSYCDFMCSLDVKRIGTEEILLSLSNKRK